MIINTTLDRLAREVIRELDKELIDEMRSLK